MKEKGIKNDSKKLRWDLLPFQELEGVVSVLTHGAKKYSDENWKLVVAENPQRYFAAAMRHLVAWKKGEIIEKASGQNHLAHAVCCCLFLMYLDTENDKNTKNTK